MRFVFGSLLVALAGVPATGASAQSVAPLTVKAPGLIASGLAITLEGTGAPSGQQVGLQVADRSTGAVWRQVGVASSRSDGSFRLSYRPKRSSGRYRVRAVAGSQVSNVKAISQRPVVLAAAGDVNLGDVPGAAIARFGPNWPWASVGASLRSADLAMVNLECAVSRRGSPVAKAFRFRGSPSSLRAAARTGGIDVVNVANNHAGDYGRQAFLDTLSYSRRYGLVPVGGGLNSSRALEPGIVKRLGLRIAFVGFSSIGPASFAAGRGTPGTAWATPGNVRTAVRRARKKADVVVATFHWGIELARTPSADQRRFAAIATSSGASVVIGAHPHVLQPIGQVRGRKLVAYSLGNFVFGANSPGTENTGILKVSLSARGAESRSFRPARISGGRPILR